MKLTFCGRWNRNPLNFYGRYNSRMSKKKIKRNLSGKYAILLREKSSRCAAILKFYGRRKCTAQAPVILNKNILKMISPRFVIRPKRNKEILSKIEVIVNKKFADDYRSLQSIIRKPKSPPKTYTCSTCNHKFTNKTRFDAHAKTHKNDLGDSSCSEGELVIDDDVMLVLDEDDNNDMHVAMTNELNHKRDPAEAKAEEFLCMIGNCQQKFDKETSLVLHIGFCHEKTDKSFKCTKCDSSFTRESGLVAHQRISHPIVVEPEPVEPQKKVRRKSVYPTTTQVNGTSKEQLKNSNSPKVNGSSIRFQRYESSKTKFICRICSASFEQRTFLDRHITVHHIAKLYYCYKCKSAFTMSKLLEHLKFAHLQFVNEPNYISTIKNIESVASHRCAFCIYSSRIRSEVCEHMQDEHYDEFEKSGATEEEASSPDSLENLFLPETVQILSERELELSKKKPETQKKKPETKRRLVNDPSFKFRCFRCQRRFSRPDKLRNHVCLARLELKTANSSHKVSNTPLRITAKSQMVNGFFNCLKCPQIFTDREMFSKHVLIHEEVSVKPT